MTNEAHSARAHARLAPSAAHRWMHCPGSVRLSDGMPNETSSFAAEGTAAHELCAQCLEWGHEPAAYAGMYVDIKAEGTDDRFLDTPIDTDDENRFFEITEEMVDAVAMYVDHVRHLRITGGANDAPAILDVEQRLDMTHLHPGIFGTGDATVFDPVDRHLHVCDFKYGKGVAVDADDNPQLLLYAAGAARRLHNAQIEKLTMHIVQPRAPHPKGPIRSYEIDLLDLFEFEDTLAAAAAETDKPDAAVVAGDWCRFCPAQPVCPTVRAKRLAAAAEEFGDVGEPIALAPPETLSDEKLGALLREADQIGNYVKAVQEYAHAQAMAGKMPAGFKLVAKRAVRRWKNEDEAEAKLLALAIEPFEEPKLKSPAKVEGQFPGKNKAERQKAMADLVEAKSSGTNLVPIEDPRAPVVVGAVDEFGAVDAE